MGELKPRLPKPASFNPKLEAALERWKKLFDLARETRQRPVRAIRHRPRQDLLSTANTRSALTGVGPAAVHDHVSGDPVTPSGQ